MFNLKIPTIMFINMLFILFHILNFITQSNTNLIQTEWLVKRFIMITIQSEVYSVKLY